MKGIIFTVTNDLNYDQRMKRICSTLVEAGYDVELVGRQKKGSIPLGSQTYRQKRLKLFFSRGKLFYVEYNFRLFFYLLFSRMDAICAVDLDTIIAGLLASRLKGAKLIYDAHEYFTEVPELLDRPIVKKVWEWIARFAVPKADLAYTVNYSLAALFNKKYGKKFEVIRNVPERVETRQLKETKLNKPFILLYQGVLNAGRGLKEVIIAMKELNDTELWLLGEGDLSAQLRVLAMEYQVESKVKFFGYVSPENLNAINSQAHLGLNLLNPKSLNYYYSLANKALDYIQAGLPSVNMNYPEYLNIQKEFEVFYLIEKLEMGKIVEAIDYLNDNPEEYSRLSQNCIAAARILNWENEKSKLLKIYETLNY